MPEDTVKCLVWDLDGTLWPDTLLEGGGTAVAEEVRAVVRELDARGILQSVASRNDHDHAWPRLEQLGLAEYFVLPQIGWGRKSDSVRAIADGLGFAPRTMAFVDDQPVERAEVAHHLPDVRCYPAADLLGLTALPEFSPRVSVDSRRRRQLYQAGFRRSAERAAHTGPDEDFLRTLDLVVEIAPAAADDLVRVEELTLRTSQMNATGVHYSYADLDALRADPAHQVLVAAMGDRFGPHGAIGVLLVRSLPGAWHLKLLATSCRVVSLGAGTTILDWLVDQAFHAGVDLIADFRRTDRNRIMEVAYRFAGFTDLDPDRPTALPPAEEGVQRLHLVPAPRPASSTARLVGPDLTAWRAAAAQGRL